ncbi:MAG: 30S ribosomal protein S16 [Luteitalea sp.]|nr:30S ribosomal protein S16 [Luteitalea sp.]
MLVIRLRRHGAKRSPFYRIVVAEDASRRDGRFVEVIGHYNPRTKPEQVKLDYERLAHWQSKGAQVSDTVRTLAVRHKGAVAAERGTIREGGEPVPETAGAVADTTAPPPSAAPDAGTEEAGPSPEQAPS